MPHSKCLELKHTKKLSPWILNLTVKFRIVAISSFDGAGRPQVPLGALYQSSQVGMWVDCLGEIGKERGSVLKAYAI